MVGLGDGMEFDFFVLWEMLQCGDLFLSKVIVYLQVVGYVVVCKGMVGGCLCIWVCLMKMGCDVFVVYFQVLCEIVVFSGGLEL